MYIDYYKAIESIIKQGLNSIKTVDWFNNQYTRYKDLDCIEFPVVYIEFDSPIKWMSGANSIQFADTTIKVHLVVFDIEDSPEKALTIAGELHKTLTGKALKKTRQLSSELIRDQSELITEYDQLKVFVLSYKTTLYDYSTMKQLTPVSPALNITQKTTP